MHFLPGVAIQPNLELKTRPKQHLGSLPLLIALPAIDMSADAAYLFTKEALMKSSPSAAASSIYLLP
jgi:hypothetical protein